MKKKLLTLLLLTSGLFIQPSSSSNNGFLNDAAFDFYYVNCEKSGGTDYVAYVKKGAKKLPWLQAHESASKISFSEYKKQQEKLIDQSSNEDNWAY